MQRRDFVKAIMAATAASAATPAALAQQQAAPAAATPPPPPTAPGPVPWMKGLMEAKPLPIGSLVADSVARSDARFLTERQFSTLRRLCEIFQPPMKGYPGALEAGVPEFLDFLIGVSPAERQQSFQAGLNRLDAEAQQRFGQPLAAVTAAQADQLIRPWLRTWMSDHPPTEPYENFINLVHEDIRTATENSQVWSDAVRRSGKETPNVDLYWYPVDPDLHRDGAPSLALKSTHTKA